MKKEIESAQNIRKSIQKIVSDLTVKQLNQVPKSFNNNIIWNMAHVIAVQQLIFYKNSGLTFVVEPLLCKNYSPGTKPEKDLSKEEIEDIKGLMITTLDQLDSDYRDKKFGDFKSMSTPLDVSVDNVEEALPFLLFHEGAHFGYILALKHMVK